jgi:FixJ family two-component response regulator
MIFVVDDDADRLAALLDLLKVGGHAVRRFDTARAALARPWLARQTRS